MGDTIAKILLYAQLPTDAPTQTKFQRFVSDSPLSSFKKLIVSTPRILRCLHMMSLAKAAPKDHKEHECRKITLHQCPLISYVPEKDSVQEMVSALKAESLKTQIGKGMLL
jgi:hypothetical protein